MTYKKEILVQTDISNLKKLMNNQYKEWRLINILTTGEFFMAIMEKEEE